MNTNNDTPISFLRTTQQMAHYARNGRDLEPQSVPVCVEELETKARLVLSPEAFDWVAGGAGSEQTICANRSAIHRWQIVPRMLQNVNSRDLSINLLGQSLPVPFLLAPIGVQGIVHPDGETATARAAASLGVPFVLSTVSSTPMEAVADAMGTAARWFQIYWPNDDELTISFLNRAERAGYTAIVVTLDTRALGWRDRNLSLGYLPFLHGEGLANYTSDPVFSGKLPPNATRNDTVSQYLQVFSNLSHTWKDLAFLRKHTRLPLIVKGIQHPDDARKAVDAGVDGIVVSNHGGRQVDGAVGSLTVLPEIIEIVSDRVPVLFDSGVRRGADIFKALAIGARAVLIGRPYMYALATGGEHGVRQFLLNLTDDLSITMANTGCASIADICRDHVRYE